MPADKNYSVSQFHQRPRHSEGAQVEDAVININQPNVIDVNKMIKEKKTKSPKWGKEQ